MSTFLRADFHFQRNCSLAKYFACFLLNSEHQNNLVLHHYSQLKRNFAKIFESEIFRASGNQALLCTFNYERTKISSFGIFRTPCRIYLKIARFFWKSNFCISSFQKMCSINKKYKFDNYS